MITANQGANGSNGLINVYTKRPGSAPSATLSTTKVSGFSRSVPFPITDYTTSTSTADGTDYRPTVYWNPQLTLESAHPTTLYFFTTDQLGPYRVVVEGVTDKNGPVHAEAVFVVRE